MRPYQSVTVALALILAASGARAQATLSDTFDLIRSSIASEGAVVWQGNVHDSGDNSDWTYQRRVEFSNFSYNIAACQFLFHYRVITNGAVSAEIDAGVPFRDVRIIKIVTEAELVGQRDARAGHPTWRTRNTPEIYDLDIIRLDGTDNIISFYSMGNANHAMDLFVHAASLCGVSRVETH